MPPDACEALPKGGLCSVGWYPGAAGADSAVEATGPAAEAVGRDVGCGCKGRAARPAARAWHRMACQGMCRLRKPSAPASTGG